MKPYVRAKTLCVVAPGFLLPSRTDAYIVAMARRAKVASLEFTRLNYRMRLAAMTAADTRKGKVW